MEAYAGIDLHSTNSYIGIIDEQDQRHFAKRLPNSISQILMALEPFKEDLKGVVVESTYNWYWLVDGLHEEGYKVHLANPSAIKQYEGLKHTDDKWDSFWLAHMCLSRCHPEKSMVLILRNINPYYQMLFRTSNLLPQLTKLFKSVTLFYIHLIPPA